MSNQEKYDAAFIQTFLVHPSDLPELKYQAITAWDSVGHMQLVGALEQSFGLELDIDDIIDFSSYQKGKQILSKYKVTL